MCPDFKNPYSIEDDPEYKTEINEEFASPLIEITGVIKWFNSAKGYGFIVPDNGMPDVLIHVTCLRRDGIETIYGGSRIVCEAMERSKGYLQCFRVLSLDQSNAIHPSQMPLSRTHVTVSPNSELELARVKWFNRLRGFGFLTRGEGTEDIFIHMETMRRYGFTELRPGQTLLVRFGPGPKGLMATEIWPKDKIWFDDAHRVSSRLINSNDDSLLGESEITGVLPDVSSTRLSYLFQGDLGLSKLPAKETESGNIGAEESTHASSDQISGSSNTESEVEEISASRLTDLFLGRNISSQGTPKGSSTPKQSSSSPPKDIAKHYH